MELVGTLPGFEWGWKLWAIVETERVSQFMEEKTRAEGGSGMHPQEGRDGQRQRVQRHGRG